MHQCANLFIDLELYLMVMNRSKETKFIQTPSDVKFRDNQSLIKFPF